MFGLWFNYSFSLFSVLTTVPAPTTTPKGKKDKTISKVEMTVMMMMIANYKTEESLYQSKLQYL